MRRSVFIFLMSIMTLGLCAQIDSTKKITKYQVLTGYSTDIYNQPYSRIFDVYHIGFGFKKPRTALYGIVNLGHLVNDSLRGNKSELQYELDFYQQLTKTTNLWVNYAYSDGFHFPNHRFMMRIWQKLPYNFLISGGFKYFYFDNNIYIATAGLERYMGRFWVEGKTFIFFKEPKTKYAFQFNSRYFWKDINYLQLTLMTGAAPDEPWRTDGSTNLKAETVMLSVSTYINKKQTIQLKSGVGYSYEEYQLNTWRNRYVGNVGFIFTL